MKLLTSAIASVCLLSGCSTAYTPLLTRQPIRVTPLELNQYWSTTTSADRRLQVNEGQRCHELSLLAGSDSTIYATLELSIDSAGNVYNPRIEETESFPASVAGMVNNLAPYMGYEKIKYTPTTANSEKQPVLVTFPMYFIDCPDQTSKRSNG